MTLSPDHNAAESVQEGLGILKRALHGITEGSLEKDPNACELVRLALEVQFRRGYSAAMRDAVLELVS